MDRDTNRVIVNIEQACDIAMVSRRTIYNWLSAGKLEYIRTAGGDIRIYRDTLFTAGANRGNRRRIAVRNEETGRIEA